MSQETEAQDRLVQWVKDLHLPACTPNYPFMLPRRKFELDLAWPGWRLGVEVEGAIWTGGAHGRGTGIERDMEKQNLAVLEGWRILRVTTRQAKSGSCIPMIARMFGCTVTLQDVERLAAPGRRARRVAKEIDVAQKKAAAKPKPKAAAQQLTIKKGTSEVKLKLPGGKERVVKI